MSDMGDIVKKYISEYDIPETSETDALKDFLEGTKSLAEAQFKVDETVETIKNNHETIFHNPISHILETKRTGYTGKFLLMATILRTTRGALGLLKGEDDIFGLQFNHKKDDKQERGPVIAVYENHETGKFGTAGSLDSFFPDAYKDIPEVIIKNIKALNWPSAEISVIEFKEEDLKRVLMDKGPISLKVTRVLDLDHAKIYGNYLFREDTPLGTVTVRTTENEGFCIMDDNEYLHLFADDVGDLGNIMTDYLVYFLPDSKKHNPLEVYMISKKDATTKHMIMCGYQIHDDGKLELKEIYESIGEEIDDDFSLVSKKSSNIYRPHPKRKGIEFRDEFAENIKLDPNKVSAYDKHAQYILGEVNINKFFERYRLEQQDGTYQPLDTKS